MKAGIKDWPKRSEVWNVDLGPTRGSEIKKTRPVLVISCNENNQFSRIFTVIPISGLGKKVYAHEVFLKKGDGGLTKDSKARAQQIRAVDKSRLKKKIGSLSHLSVNKIEVTLLRHLGFRTS